MVVSYNTLRGCYESPCYCDSAHIFLYSCISENPKHLLDEYTPYVIYLIKINKHLNRVLSIYNEGSLHPSRCGYSQVRPVALLAPQVHQIPKIGRKETDSTHKSHAPLQVNLERGYIYIPTDIIRKNSSLKKFTQLSSSKH